MIGPDFSPREAAIPEKSSDNGPVKSFQTKDLLCINNYSLTLKNAEGHLLPVLEHVDITLQTGKCLGLVGESGSGKSVLALGLLGLIPADTIVAASGSVQFDGRNLLNMDERSLRPLRGKRIAMVFQEPMTAMNPLMTLYEQIAETVRTHEPAKDENAVSCRVEKALRAAGFSEPKTYYDSFPHQLSGGMRQRAMLAMALVMDPDLIVADEPTTALDAALQVQLLAELRSLVKKHGHSLLFISHDLGVIRAIADFLTILYAGQVMESGPAQPILEAPAHPYSAALVSAMPRLIHERKLPHPIPGHLPSPDHKPKGCVFSDRCPYAQPPCRVAIPEFRELKDGRRVRCLFPLHS